MMVQLESGNWVNVDRVVGIQIVVETVRKVSVYSVGVVTDVGSIFAGVYGERYDAERERDRLGNQFRLHFERVLLQQGVNVNAT